MRQSSIQILYEDIPNLPFIQQIYHENTINIQYDIIIQKLFKNTITK